MEFEAAYPHLVDACLPYAQRLLPNREDQADALADSLSVLVAYWTRRAGRSLSDHIAFVKQGIRWWRAHDMRRLAQEQRCQAIYAWQTQTEDAQAAFEAVEDRDLIRPLRALPEAQKADLLAVAGGATYATAAGRRNSTAGSAKRNVHLARRRALQLLPEPGTE